MRRPRAAISLLLLATSCGGRELAVPGSAVDASQPGASEDAGAGDTPDASSAGDVAPPPPPDAGLPPGCPAPIVRRVASGGIGAVTTIAVDATTIYVTAADAAGMGHLYSYARTAGALAVDRGVLGPSPFFFSMRVSEGSVYLRTWPSAVAPISLERVLPAPVTVLDVGIPEIGAAEGYEVLPGGTFYAALTRTTAPRAGIWETAIGGPAQQLTSTGTNACGPLVIDGDTIYFTTDTDQGKLSRLALADNHVTVLGPSVGWTLTQDRERVYITEPTPSGVLLAGYAKATGTKTFSYPNGWFRANGMKASAGWLYWSDFPYFQGSQKFTGRVHRIRTDGTCPQDLGPDTHDVNDADTSHMFGDDQGLYYFDGGDLVEVR